VLTPATPFGAGRGFLNPLPSFFNATETAMPNSELFAGALSQLLRHDLSGCPRATRQAADLLDRLARLPGLDAETRELCDRMSQRLDDEGELSCA
jgi:hypothetical protein